MEVVEKHVTENYSNVFNNPESVVNNPDNEDIQSVGEVGKEVIQFADKQYNRSNFSGLGRIYLRKNISDGKNLLVQTMLPSASTIYIIQYDYDLNGATINIPSNCVLNFQGGSLKNGKIVGSNTIIRAGLEQIFYEGISFEGSFKSNKSYPEWFGANGDGVTESSAAINSCLSAFSNAYLSAKSKYLISEPIFLQNSYVIKGDGFSSQLIGSPECLIKGDKDGSDYLKDILMRDFSIVGDGTNIGMNLGNFSLSTIDNVSIWTTIQGVVADDIWQVSFRDVISRNLPDDPVQDIGFSFNTGTSIIMTRCWSRRCKIGFSLGSVMYSCLCSCVVEDFSERGYTGGQQWVFLSCGAEAANLVDDGCIFHLQYRQHTILGASFLNIKSVASADKPASIIRCVGANATIMGIRGENAVSGENITICKCDNYGTVNIYNSVVSTVSDPIVESSGKVCIQSGTIFKSYGSPISFNEMPTCDGYKIVDVVTDTNSRLTKFSDGTFICAGTVPLNGTAISTPYTSFGLNAYTTESTLQYTMPAQIKTVKSFSVNICTYSGGATRDAFVVTSNAFTSDRAVFGIKPVVSVSVGSSNNLYMFIVVTGIWK